MGHSDLDSGTNARSQLRGEVITCSHEAGLLPPGLPEQPGDRGGSDVDVGGSDGGAKVVAAVRRHTLTPK